MKLRNLIQNKKGAADLATNSVISVVIGLAVLVVAVVLVFDMGGFRTKLFTPAGGSSNIDQLRINCRSSCDQITASGTGGYVADPKAVVFADGVKSKLTCQQMESPSCIAKDGTVLVAEGKAQCEAGVKTGGTWTAITGRTWHDKACKQTDGTYGATTTTCTAGTLEANVCVDSDNKKIDSQFKDKDSCIFECKSSEGTVLTKLITKATCETTTVKGTYEAAIITDTKCSAIA